MKLTQVLLFIPSLVHLTNAACPNQCNTNGSCGLNGENEGYNFRSFAFDETITESSFFNTIGQR
jgi:hypothetical protein